MTPAGNDQMQGQLGFGCAFLRGGFEKRASEKLVAAAVDMGFRYFDVAPPYGGGDAERILGEALAGRKRDIVIATKVGISRPSKQGLVRFARALAKPVKAILPGLVRSAGRHAYVATARRRCFARADVMASVEESLRWLRTDHIDVLLLHEVLPEDVGDNLIATLQSLQESGKIGALGLATSYDAGKRIADAHPGTFSVIQYGWSPTEPALPPQAAGLKQITHQALSRGLGALRDRLRDDGFRRRAEAVVGVGLLDQSTVAGLLIAAAVAENPDGLTLVSSSKTDHLASNLAAANDPARRTAGIQLMTLLREAQAAPGSTP